MSRTGPRLSFVIPVFNCVDLTRQVVRDLRRTVPGADWEAIIVDDASSDETPAFLGSLDRPFRSIRFEENGGFAHAVNRGAAEAQGEILGFLNNDLILADGWLPPMLALLDTSPDAGAVGNVQMNPATGLVDHAGVFFDPWGMPTHAHKNRRRPPPGPWRERSAATAACMLMRKAFFLELGGFSEDYRNGMEDIDLCVRLKQAGRRIYVSHKSVIGHLVSSSPGRHDANDANTRLYRERHSATAAAWRRNEWPGEYFRRYARHWWRMNPSRAWLALRMLLGLTRRGPDGKTH